MADTSEKGPSEELPTSAVIQPDASGSSIRLEPGRTAVVPIAIAKALVAVQKEVSPLKKTAENPHFKNSYVPLSEVVESALRIITRHGLGISQWPITHQGKTWLLTILMHESGASIQGEQELLLAQQNSQGQGSSITYARRYGIMAILGLVGDDDDDDGNKAAGRQAKPTAEQISEIRQLCIDLKYSTDQVATRVASLRTEDQATVALANLHKNMSQRAQLLKEQATAIPVFTGDKDQVVPPEVIGIGVTGDSLVDQLNKDLLALPIPSARKRELVLKETGKPFLKNCSADQLAHMRDVIKAIQVGTYELPKDWADPDITAPEETA